MSTILLYVVHLLWIPLITGSIESAQSSSKANLRVCARAVGSIAYVTDDKNGDPEENSTELPFVRCETSHCYTFWNEDANGTVNIMGQGCWVSSGKPPDCGRTQCVSDKKPPKAMNNTKFCCCAENMCNANFTDAYIPVEETPAPTTEALPRATFTPLLCSILSLFLIIFIITVSVIAYIFRGLKPKKSDMETGQPVLPPPSDYSLDKLKLCSAIGQGRFGSVWRGLVDDQEVAVKIFPAHHRNYFINEHELYNIAGENGALLKCFGGGERCLVPGGLTDFMLLFSLEQECLQEYLRDHVLDLPTLCKMSLGVAKGLAHLHSDLGKPCIAHRDINTRNILVRTDLSCCICDLGLAVVPRKTENHSLSEAGTLRYMAPEVLEGAVNLQDCETALKQIDVYALGLVLWELGTRCTDMQAAEPQSYGAPFYKEAGDNPSLEQMQVLICRRKARPLWPLSWKDTAAARSLCETAEDCWDQDAEARLTSLCVEERLLELPTLRGRVLHPMHPPASPTLINNNHLHDHTMDVSVNTIETLLSPTEENSKNSNQLAACITPLQPYQGRNPCLERNLLSESSDSLLIDKSSKHCTSSESQNLITNDFLNFQINHRATPIPYVQNAVYRCPKQYNSTIINPSKSKFKWANLKKLFHNKKDVNSDIGLCKDTKVQIVPCKLVNSFGQNGVTTTLLNENEIKRPSTLPLTIIKTQDDAEQKSNISGVHHILKSKDSVTRQRSLEQFKEVFSSTSDLSRLKDPSIRIKTPGDVPPSVRRTRGKAANESARFSLYDDRMMCRGQWGSAPDLEPQVPPLKPSQLHDLQDRDSISSF